VVFVPVGGGLSVNAAAALISQLAPKIVIPMPVVDEQSKATAAIKAFCKEEGLTAPPAPQQKLVVTISALPEETTTVVLEPRAEGFGG
jgi:hypothetical protein